jgi:hypothetical protein
MKTNAELSKLVTQAVCVLELHAPSDGIKDKEAIKRVGIFFKARLVAKHLRTQAPTNFPN